MSHATDRLPDAVRDELLCIADTKWVLGHWYIKLIQNGRSLTDFNALAAMSQDQLGHTRSFFGMLEEWGQSSERLEFGRTRLEVHSMDMLDAPPAGWADFLVTASLAEYALRTLLGAYDTSSNRVLGNFAVQCEREAEFHSLYLDGGLQGLSDTEREEAHAAFARRYPLAQRWFAPHKDDPVAASGWRGSTADSLLADFKRIAAEGVAAHLETALPADSPVPADWDYARRRVRGTGMPPRLWEFVVPTSEQAVMCRRPLIESTKDSIRFTATQ